MVEYEVPCGLVTPDDKQIWVNRQSEQLFHASGQELVQVKTSDFWHPADLADFHQKIRQTSKNVSFEYTYRARMGFKKNEDGSDIWMQLTNVYEIIDDAGNRLARNLGSREIAYPVVQ
ncbi:MAG: PAS domain-containing protein [Okeania sp. SIO2D1]|nr:PAS domain-containing protein [Okeania sp. SIO2D1]